MKNEEKNEEMNQEKTRTNFFRLVIYPSDSK